MLINRLRVQWWSHKNISPEDAVSVLVCAGTLYVNPKRTNLKQFTSIVSFNPFHCFLITLYFQAKPLIHGLLVDPSVEIRFTLCCSHSWLFIPAKSFSTWWSTFLPQEFCHCLFFFVVLHLYVNPCGITSARYGKKQN